MIENYHLSLSNFKRFNVPMLRHRIIYTAEEKTRKSWAELVGNIRWLCRSFSTQQNKWKGFERNSKLHNFDFLSSDTK